MACSSTLQYLLDIVQTEELTSMAKLAALSILNKLFISDATGATMEKCIKADIVSSLLTAFDLGLSDSCDPADVVYISVAMETMSRLTKLPYTKCLCLSSEPVLKRLLAYMDATGPFYRFSSKTKDVLGELCQNKQLIGKVKVVAMGMEPLEYIHLHTKNKLKSTVRLPDSIKLCDMYDTQGAEDLSVSEYFTRSGITWEGSFPGDIVKDYGDDWQEILVTEALDGGMFWGQVGEKCIKEVNMIQQQLNSGTELQEKDVVKLGDMVAVRGNIAGTNCFLRAQVMSSEGREVNVFAVDFGYTMTITAPEVYCLPEQLGVTIIPRKISLCSVAGVQPKPYDESLVQLAACVLTSMCKQSFLSGEIICQLGGLGVLQRLLEKRLVPGLTTQLVSLTSNLACNNRVRSEVTNSGIIATLIGVLERHIDDIKDRDLTSLSADSDDRMAIIRSIMALTNLMMMNSAAREHFYTGQGIDVIIQLLMVLGNKRDVMYRMCVRLLRAFIGKAMIKPSTPDTPQSLKPSSSNIPPVAREMMERVKGVQVPNPAGDARENGREELDRNKNASTCDSDSEADFHLGTESQFEPQSGQQPLIMGLSEERYYRGGCLGVYDDDTHEILPSRQVESISAATLAQHICGMLNTGHGGMIYCGADKERNVFGLDISREEKDRFRMGIDQIMHSKIRPVVLHSQFDIRIRHVYDPDTDIVIPDLYIIEICMQPSAGSIYVSTDGICYYRFGSETSCVSRLELRQLIAIDTEARFIDDVKSLQQERDDLMLELQLTSGHPLGP